MLTKFAYDGGVYALIIIFDTAAKPPISFIVTVRV